MSTYTTLPPEEEERPGLARLGAGSFAAVFVISGGPVAYKQVLLSNAENAKTLRDEYDTLLTIHAQCKSPATLFAIPRPFALNDPTSMPNIFHTTYPPNPHTHNYTGPTHPVVTPGVMAFFKRPTYAMDRVHALPPDVRHHLACLYFPPGISPTGPSLCRLYFGKALPVHGATTPAISEASARVRRPQFVNTHNFPLDASRYRALTDSKDLGVGMYLPPAEQVARGMGEMLARMHWRAGVNAQDIEFVLGGDGGGGFAFFVIDFNQVRRWDKHTESVTVLSAAFFLNDPYYPRPRSSARESESDALYDSFKAGYFNECPIKDRTLAEEFLHAIEQEQVRRDASRSRDTQEE